MAILPKLIYRFNPVLIRMLVDFFIEINKLILKLIKNCNGPRIAKTVLKKNKAGRFTFPNFKTYLKTTVNKIVWYWH